MTNAVKGTSLWESGLLWFGAALSIAEMQTGTFFAPLGMQQGITAIVLGHIIGCALLFGAGLIGGQTRKSSMETVKMSFGAKGGCLFALLNVLQLLGWTGIMIYEGGLAASTLFGTSANIWCSILGFMIMVWIAIGLKNLGKLNALAMTALMLLTIVLSFSLFDSADYVPAASEGISFALALELSIAMPLSWLPLISDYTREAKKPLQAAAVSTIVYGFVSCWMYIIGLGAALTFGENDIAQVMAKSGLGIAGLFIILLSTVTTTFLDAYSAGVSSKSLASSLNAKSMSLIVTFIGTVGAMFLPLLDFTEFLYFIGSVFAPMIAIQLTDYFIIGRHYEQTEFPRHNLLLWLAGFGLYRLLIQADLSVGSTLPAMIFTMLLCLAVNTVQRNRKAEYIKQEA